jgi:3-dehydroquinate synthase
VKQENCVKVGSLACPVYIGTEIWHDLDMFLQPYHHSGGIYLLTDVNTKNHCFPVLENHLPWMTNLPLFSVCPGEKSKDTANLEQLWAWLMESGAMKDSLLINLGGGVISDLGGFAAATYKRGIRYINIPTSLIGQADAAVGGKTGINISGVKNQSGLFYEPSAVFINPDFLATLPEIHFRSGFAEIIKCAALSGNGFWDKIKNKDAGNDNLTYLIFETVNFKGGVVARDPFDYSVRKILNFGHTVGHALESFFAMPGQTGLLHGEAVAAGMICEAYISCETTGMIKEELEDLTAVICNYFDLKPFDNKDFDRIIRLMDHDKKRSGAGIGFSLLESLGKPVTGISAGREIIIRSLEYFNNIFQSDQDK